MSKRISDHITLIKKVFIILTVGFLNSLAIAMEYEENSYHTQDTLTKKYNLTEIFQQIVIENQDIIVAERGEPEKSKLFRQQHGALTELLKKDSKDSWAAVVDYIAKSDFILDTLYSFCRLGHNDVLDRLILKKDAWNYHVQEIGSLLENYGEDIVSNPAFGSSLKNLITCKFKMTTFVYLKAVANVMKEAKDSEPEFNNSIHEIKQIVTSYLETHDLLTRS